MNKISLITVTLCLVSIFIPLTRCSFKKQEAATENSSPIRRFKFTSSLDSLGSDQFILASYNNNIIDTLDRILISSFDHFVIKGRNFSVSVSRIDVNNYKAQLTDHRNFDTVNPHEISGYHAEIEFSSQDTLNIALSNEIINPTTNVGTEVNVKKTDALGNNYEIFGRANLPVLDGNDFDNSYRKLPKL